ncbi:MAG: HAD family phosphatase [Bryobacterales bacterium]|nr:HAD family phosphatase [Bryobacterales bacterium]
MLKALIFDLGNVILAFDFMRSYQTLAKMYNWPPERVPDRSRLTGLLHSYESGGMSSAVFFGEMAQTLGLDGLSFEQFRDIWFSIFDTDTLCPESFFEYLSKSYRLILLSNTNELHFDMIRQRFPLLGHFHHLVLSYEVGVMKPAPRIYQEAIRAAGCKPEECFYTDDIQDYVDAGRNAGLDAVRFQSYQQLRAELTARSVTLPG